MFIRFLSIGGHKEHINERHSQAAGNNNDWKPVKIYINVDLFSELHAKVLPLLIFRENIFAAQRQILL